MAAPLLDAVVAAGKRVDVLCGPLVRQVLADRESRVRFLEGARLTGLDVLRVSRRLRDYGQVLLVNRSFRSALAARLARIPERVGHATEGRGFLLTHPVVYDEARYEAECYLDLWRAAGHAIDEGVRPSLGVSPEDRQRGADLAAGATVGVQPGARYSAKQYPAEAMAKVISKLQQEGHNVALLGGKDETESAERFQSLLPEPCVNLVGRCSIRETMGVLANLRVAVGSDTGVMHLAVGVGCPSVTIFGPNPASKWGHRFGPHQVLEAPEGKPALLEPAQVVAAVRRALEAAE